MGLSIKKRGWFPSQKFQGTDQHAGLQGPRPYTPAACTAPTVTNPVSCLGRVSPCMMYRYLGYKVLRVPSGSKTAAQTVGVIFFCSLLCWALELGEEMEYGSTSLYPQVEHTPCLWLALGDLGLAEIGVLPHLGVKVSNPQGWEQTTLWPLCCRDSEPQWGSVE